MTRPTGRQVDARAWEFRSGWGANLAMLAVGLFALWAFDLPWWVLLVGWLLLEPGLSVAVAWLSFRNDAAPQETDAEQTGEAG